MTAEIAIMNQEAVALAADSAVTTNPGGNQKIFSSANKLFALSDIAPVGILVYGNARFGSIPWETIVKEYRRILGRKTFDRLQDYATDFCQFLSDEIGNRISEEEQFGHASAMVLEIFREINKSIDQQTMQSIDKVDDDDGVFDMKKVQHLENRLTDEIVDRYHTSAKNAILMVGATEQFEKEVRKKITRRTKELRSNVFSQPLSRSVQQKLNTIAVKSIVGFYEETSSFTSGVVVAGFGDLDLFPSISRLEIGGMIQGELKRNPDRLERTVDYRKRSFIVPFAQTDMVQQFMQGIALDYLVLLKRLVIAQLDENTNQLLEGLRTHGVIEVEVLREKLDQHHIEVTERFIEKVSQFSKKHYTRPIMNVVSSLPKEQLAEMAESLVNLTALKRRVSNQEETVGGPTDVALISKGDGLIWIKRKHYFDPQLNPSYFAKLSYRRSRMNLDVLGGDETDE